MAFMQHVICVMVRKQGLNQVSGIAIKVPNMLASHAHVLITVRLPRR